MNKTTTNTHIGHKFILETQYRKTNKQQSLVSSIFLYYGDYNTYYKDVQDCFKATRHYGILYSSRIYLCFTTLLTFAQEYHTYYGTTDD